MTKARLQHSKWETSIIEQRSWAELSRGTLASSAEGSGQLKSDAHLSIFLERAPLIEEKKERSEGRMLERLLEMVKASSLSLLYIEDYVVPDKIPACIELS